MKFDPVKYMQNADQANDLIDHNDSLFKDYTD